MLMTSNSRARQASCWRRRMSLCALATVASILPVYTSGAQAVQLPPDAPRIRAAVAPEVRPPPISNEWLQPVELRAVRVLRPDSALRRLAGGQFVTQAPDALVIEVRTARALDPTARTSWPVIVLNGQPIASTVGSADSLTILYGFLADRSRIRDRNVVEVYWVGNEQLTRTRQPLVFTRRQVPPRR